MKRIKKYLSILLALAIAFSMVPYTFAVADYGGGGRKAVECESGALMCIEVTTLPAKVSYWLGEELDLDGMIVTATYEDEYPIEISFEVSDYITNPVDGAILETAGTQTINISYTDDDVTVVTSFNVAVSVPKLVSIAVTTLPTKVTYLRGDKLDLDDMIVTATYENESSHEVTAYITDPADGALLETVGTQTISISYTEDDVAAAAALDVTVNVPKLESIAVTTNPAIVTYLRGDKLDLGGMIVTATYENESSREVTAYTTDPADGALLETVGTQTISISYTEDDVAAAATFDVIVKRSQSAPPTFELIYTGVDDTSYIVTIPLTEGAEYSFDELTWDNVNTKTDCLPDQTITGYMRMIENTECYASPATTHSVTLPLFIVKTPTISPNGGTFSSNQSVTLLCETTAATIYYTLDGTVPTIDSSLYKDAIDLTYTVTINAIAVKEGMTDSAVMGPVTFTKRSTTSNNNNNNNNSNAQNPAPVAIEPVVTPLAGWGSFSAFIIGYPDLTFKGQNFMTREEFVNILYKLKNPDALPNAETDSPSYSDVKPGRWSYNAVEWAKEAGIIETNSGNFRPSNPITRSEVASMLVKLEGWIEKAENSFSDIETHPNSDDILKAVQAGIFIGYPDNTFKPDDGINRYELVTAMVRYLLHGEPEDSIWINIILPFSDIAVDHWAYKYVAIATSGYTAPVEE